MDNMRAGTWIASQAGSLNRLLRSGRHGRMLLAMRQRLIFAEDASGKPIRAKFRHTRLQLAPLDGRPLSEYDTSFQRQRLRWHRWSLAERPSRPAFFRASRSAWTNCRSIWTASMCRLTPSCAQHGTLHHVGAATLGEGYLHLCVGFRSPMLNRQVVSVGSRLSRCTGCSQRLRLQWHGWSAVGGPSPQTFFGALWSSSTKCRSIWMPSTFRLTLLCEALATQVAAGAKNLKEGLLPSWFRHPALNRTKALGGL
mmetsp:Transcript_42380/g.136953  ORF Transcript_42380/g.136953 Transcript_42380/m.136953 type:complete len:254 (+) Transcript_42380:710-1471(+)